MNRRSFFKSLAAFVAVAAALPKEALNFVAPEPIAEPLLDWIPCDGRVLRRMDYPELFRVLENKFGGEDPIEGTFCAPDLRGFVGNGLFTSQEVSPPELTITEYKISAKSVENFPIGIVALHVVHPSPTA